LGLASELEGNVPATELGELVSAMELGEFVPVTLSVGSALAVVETSDSDLETSDKPGSVPIAGIPDPAVTSSV